MLLDRITHKQVISFISHTGQCESCNKEKIIRNKVLPISRENPTEFSTTSDGSRKLSMSAMIKTGSKSQWQVSNGDFRLMVITVTTDLMKECESQKLISYWFSEISL